MKYDLDKLKQMWENRNVHLGNKLTPFNVVFSGNSHYTKRGIIKKFLVDNDVIEHKCVICENEGEWCGKPITLQLDHIDGNRHNNQIDNLRLLCPNCHSQTETFSRGKHRINKAVKSDDEYALAIQTSENARQALIKLGVQAFGGNYDRVRKVKYKRKLDFKPRLSKIIPMEDLLDLLCKHSIKEIGEMYSVSDNAVRKWMRKYGIPTNKKELKQFLEESGMEYAVKWRIATVGIKGIENKSAKLNDESVKEIRKLLRDGYSQRSIAKLFDVSASAIRDIANRKSWIHVE